MWLLSLALAADPCTPVDGSTFAGSVVSFAVGPGVEALYADPSNALGPPDFHEGAGAVSLGNRVKGGAELIVAFPAALLYDGPGDDLVIHEQGPGVEPTLLSVSADGTTWIDVGRVEGSIRGVDLKGRVPAEARFSMVRLRTGRKAAAAGPWAGPDIDAVELTNSCVPEPRVNS